MQAKNQVTLKVIAKHTSPSYRVEFGHLTPYWVNKLPTNHCLTRRNAPPN